MITKMMAEYEWADRLYAAAAATFQSLPLLEIVQQGPEKVEEWVGEYRSRDSFGSHAECFISSEGEMMFRTPSSGRLVFYRAGTFNCPAKTEILFPQGSETAAGDIWNRLGGEATRNISTWWLGIHVGQKAEYETETR